MTPTVYEPEGYQPSDDWRPMESFPKDGRVVLVRDAAGVTTEAFHDPGEGCRLNYGMTGVPIGEFVAWCPKPTPPTEPSSLARMMESAARTEEQLREKISRAYDHTFFSSFALRDPVRTAVVPPSSSTGVASSWDEMSVSLSIFGMRCRVVRA